MKELASVDHLGRQWLFNDHGHRTLEWDDHCNRAYTRWILREHGLTLTGPTPESFMGAVPALVLRREAAVSLPTLLTDRATWVDIDTTAWGQRYTVVTSCRILYTLETARVASKPGALEWALRTLEPRWRPLLAQVRDERSLGWEPERAPRPSEAEAARAFVGHVVARADRASRPKPVTGHMPVADRLAATLEHGSFSLYDKHVVTEEQIRHWADEAEAGYAVNEMKQRGRGRPGRGAEPMQVVAVRLTTEELDALDAAAAKNDMSRSEAIRAALARLGA